MESCANFFSFINLKDPTTLLKWNSTALLYFYIIDFMGY